LLIKRIEFEYEEEVRLIFKASQYKDKESRKDTTNWDIKKDIYQFQIDPVDLIDDMVFDPRMSEDLYQEHSNSFQKLGFNKSISKSTLYNEPNTICEN